MKYAQIESINPIKECQECKEQLILCSECDNEKCSTCNNGCDFIGWWNNKNK